MAAAWSRLSMRSVTGVEELSMLEAQSRKKKPLIGFHRMALTDWGAGCVLGGAELESHPVFAPPPQPLPVSRLVAPTMPPPTTRAAQAGFTPGVKAVGEAQKAAKYAASSLQCVPPLPLPHDASPALGLGLGLGLGHKVR